MPMSENARRVAQGISAWLRRGTRQTALLLINDFKSKVFIMFSESGIPAPRLPGLCLRSFACDASLGSLKTGNPYQTTSVSIGDRGGTAEGSLNRDAQRVLARSPMS